MNATAWIMSQVIMFSVAHALYRNNLKNLIMNIFNVGNTVTCLVCCNRVLDSYNHISGKMISVYQELETNQQLRLHDHWCGTNWARLIPHIPRPCIMNMTGQEIRISVHYHISITIATVEVPPGHHPALSLYARGSTVTAPTWISLQVSVDSWQNI